MPNTNNTPFPSVRERFDLNSYLVLGPADTKSRPVPDIVRQALAGGITFVQIRVKPVMIASSGDPLSSKSSVEALCTRLLPLVTLVTPNIPEAEILANFQLGIQTDNFITQTISNSARATDFIATAASGLGNGKTTVAESRTAIQESNAANEPARLTIHDEASTTEAAQRIVQRCGGCAVLIKPHTNLTEYFSLSKVLVPVHSLFSRPAADRSEPCG